MTLKITINCDNAAFEEGPGPAGEASRILKDAAEKLKDQWDGASDIQFNLHDIDGNTVGKVQLI
jgi:hypothetical protein